MEEFSLAEQMQFMQATTAKGHIMLALILPNMHSIWRKIPKALIMTRLTKELEALQELHDNDVHAHFFNVDRMPQSLSDDLPF